jgi:predicted amidohydrolase
MIVDPWGQILGQCQDKETVLVCDIDFEVLTEVRKRLPSLEHARHGKLKVL